VTTNSIKSQWIRHFSCQTYCHKIMKTMLTFGTEWRCFVGISQNSFQMCMLSRVPFGCHVNRMERRLSNMRWRNVLSCVYLEHDTKNLSFPHFPLTHPLPAPPTTPFSTSHSPPLPPLPTPVKLKLDNFYQAGMDSFIISSLPRGPVIYWSSGTAQ
jgi:hypothetical protein